jgi:hypothetical protein
MVPLRLGGNLRFLPVIFTGETGSTRVENTFDMV